MAITKIQTVTVGSGGAASIDFTSIPGTYTDLLCVYSLRSTRSGQFEDLLAIKVNTATTNLSYRELEGDGSTARSGTGANGFIGYQPAAGATANTFGNGSLLIANYAGSTNKSISADVVCENNGTQGYGNITASLWSQTAAITGLTLYSLLSNNLVQYSSATLYGITKGSSGGVTVS